MVIFPGARRIREGFKGQHLVVVPEEIRARHVRHPLLHGLFVTDAGFFPHAGRHYVERPQGAETTLVLVCLAGRGWARWGTREVAVAPGDFVWLGARCPHAYGAEPGSPWTIEWAHVGGDEVAAWAGLLELPAEGGVIPLDAGAAGALQFGRVWQCLERGYTLANLVAAGVAFRSALDGVLRARDTRDRRAPRDRVAATVDWMKANLGRPPRLEELAALAALSPSHYSALFRRQTGFSPVDFFLRLRIQRACQLLATTEAGVGAIAREVGFADPYYFTRYFRRVMNCSPREYRKIPKG